MLIEEQDIRTSLTTRSKFKPSENTSNIIIDQSLLDHMKDAFDEPGHRFITLQWKLGMHLLFEIAEKPQVRILTDMARVSRKSDDFHLMIRQDL
jgi:hypothetical protein